MRHAIDVKETEDAAGRHHGRDRDIESCGAEDPFRSVKERTGNGGHQANRRRESGKHVRTRFAGVAYRNRIRNSARKKKTGKRHREGKKQRRFCKEKNEEVWFGWGTGGVKEGGGKRGVRSEGKKGGFKQRSSEGNDWGKKKTERKGNIENVLGRRHQTSIEKVVRHTESGRADEGGWRNDRMQNVGGKG